MKDINEWCEQRDLVWEDKIHRCTSCGRRLIPKETQFSQLMLPPHKKKGYKIRRKKGHNRRKNEKVKTRIFNRI
jgi:predicted RNA-binding Zn-ribbon protein involved in translation (DUF1610 family)